jgi:hypothetical protein
MKPLKFSLLLAALVSVLGTVGCSKNRGDRPVVVPVSGVVLYNGKPLAGAHVTFTNPDAKRSAYGKTDADGHFTLTTFPDEPGDGAVPGKRIDRTATTGKVPDVQRRWVIPEHYGNVTTSGLTAEVKEDGKNEIKLELKGSPEKGPGAH